MDKSLKTIKRENELLEAVKSSNLSAVQRILSKCRSGKTNTISPKKINLNFQDDHGMASIHEAALAGNIEILKLLIDHGANVNLKDEKGLRPLHYAAWQGRSEPVFILLRRGANVNEQSLTGDTPLHFACQYGHNDIVQLLLFHQADPTLVNRRQFTALDSACENGRFHLVHSLLQNSLCQRMILNRNETTVSLHLAAKNGHTDIVRLLLLNGMDINRMTLNEGTALHVACRNGRYDTAKLLLECGIDFTLVNSFDQTAADVVIKQKTGNDIKRLIKEFSDAIVVRAIRSYTDNHVGALNFNEGDSITVLERNLSGQWRGFILQEDLTTRLGYFPSSHVQVHSNDVSSDRKRTHPQFNSSIHSNANHHHVVLRHPRPSFLNSKEIPRSSSSQVPSNNGDLSPAESDSISRLSQADSALISSSGSWTSRSRRDSPTSQSYRHSAASSIDSGRSSTALYDSPKTLALSSFMALNNHSSTTVADLRSISSNDSKSSDPDKTSYRSSNSSLDRLDESNSLHLSSTLQTMLRNHASEKDIVFAWLRDFSFEEYAEHFVSNGYDIQTIVRMTPEDLTAIGITHPVHRRKLKTEIARLHLPDALAEFQGETVDEWLSALRLTEYRSLLTEQNYYQLNDLMNIAWEDLEEIGITRLGHQKRFLLGLKRLKELRKGSNCNGTTEEHLSPLPSTPSRTSNGLVNISDRRMKSTLERCSSLENNSLPPAPRSSNYATLRKSPNPPAPSGTSSFRLPPPLSSNTLVNSSDSSSSTRARSVENLQENGKETNLGETTLSSSTESTNGLPFANENVGTIKQRSPHNSNLSNSTIDPMKRSLPLQFFEQASSHLFQTSHPIYDNNASPTHHLRKYSTLTPTQLNGKLCNSSTEKRFQYIDLMKKEKSTKIIKNDTTHVLSDIDSMLSDLNRELDQMLDYDTKPCFKR